MPQNYQILDDDFDSEDELRPEYDFAALRESDRARGIGYRRSFVRLEPDVATAFPDTEIENYWGDANIDDIQARIMQWEKRG